MVKKIFKQALLSKNIDFVIIIYDYLKYNVKIDFTKELLSRILENIIKIVGSNRDDYDNIIYEFLNLGAVIRGYSVYTDYINSIKFLPNENNKKTFLANENKKKKLSNIMIKY